MNAGEHGLPIRVGAGEDISTADTRQIILRDPRGNETTKDAILGEAGLDTPAGTLRRMSTATTSPSPATLMSLVCGSSGCWSA